jgi:hypothetical protein
MAFIVHRVSIIVGGVPAINIINIPVPIIIHTSNAISLERINPHNWSQIRMGVIYSCVDHCNYD